MVEELDPQTSKPLREDVRLVREFLTEDGYLSVSAQECPVDQERMQHCDRILEKALERAEETSAEAVMVRDPQGLEPHGSVAALLRY